MRILSTVLSLLVGIFSVAGQEIDLIKYADFENWVTRNITESKLLGGNTKKVYEIAPEMVIDGNKVYFTMNRANVITFISRLCTLLLDCDIKDVWMNL